LPDLHRVVLPDVLIGERTGVAQPALVGQAGLGRREHGRPQPREELALLHLPRRDIGRIVGHDDVCRGLIWRCSFGARCRRRGRSGRSVGFRFGTGFYVLWNRGAVRFCLEQLVVLILTLAALKQLTERSVAHDLLQLEDR
jgi:hypothetical protein